MKITRSEKFANILIIFILGLLCISIIYPFWNLIVISFNTSIDTARGGLTFFPREFTFENYANVFVDKRLVNAFIITVLRTVITTVGCTLFTGVFAYGISRKELKFRKAYTKFCAITMYLTAGLIPTYILMQKLNLINSFWVMVIPYLFSVWNMIIFRSFFDGLPPSLIEAARMDGAGEYWVFFKIVMPVSKPVFATLALFTAVAQWNAW
ncbi:MAG: carbohydrate ABC transporter permease, partial [Oscillospiraceae bacterium]